MQRILGFLVVIVMVFQSGCMSYSQGITVEIDKKPVGFDVEPFMENERVLVPFRSIFEELGLNVEWNEELKIASAYDESTSLSIKESSNYGSVNGELVELDAPARIVGGRMLVPIRFISEAFGNEVIWDGEKGLVSITSGFKTISKTENLPKVESREKLISLLEYSRRFSRPYMQYRGGIAIEQDIGTTEEAPKSTEVDYSDTNIQVEGVDEADIVKTDGEYIYQIRGDRVSIVRANGAKLSLESDILSRDGFRPEEMYLNDDMLILIGTSNEPVFRIMESDVEGMIWPYPSSSLRVEVYDVSDRSAPKRVRTVELDGRYLTSRLIENKLYMVVNKNMNSFYNGDGIDDRPTAFDSLEGEPHKIGYDAISYFPGCVISNYLITIGIDMDDPGKRADIKAYLGSGQNVYASKKNIYVANTRFDYEYKIDASEGREAYYPEYKIGTGIFKFALDEGRVEYSTYGKVPGAILNQFSMDEEYGELRIATTSGETWRIGEGTSKNNIYVLDDKMDIMGSLEGIAPTERIYSTRFIGDRAYMVTFRQIDPFYVIDLSDPRKPEILGHLKIPGYSDYLHPYDDEHIIGFGKETIQTKGRVTVEGMKVGIFDVSDVERPVEKYKEVIGDSGTDSELLYNHKALLFSKQRELMAFPITEMRKTSKGWSQFHYQGAYAYTVNLESGFQLRGRATHLSEDDYEKAGIYWYESEKNIKRILYIGEHIYTISNSEIHAHDINDMSTETRFEFEK